VKPSVLLTLLPASAVFAQALNTVQLNKDKTTIEVQWLSSSTFRLQRCEGARCWSRPDGKDKVEFRFTERATEWEFQTDYLLLTVNRKTGAATVKRARGGSLLFREAAAPGAFRWLPGASEKFYGLGPRDEPKLDIRGQTLTTTRPFLMSSEGYGLYFGVPGNYRFELAGAEPRVTGPFAGRVEYFFYYGPTPKEILAEHLGVVGAIAPISMRYVDGSGRLPPYAVDLGLESLPQAVRVLNHASLSAVYVPLVDAAKMPGPMLRFWPVVKGGAPPERAAWVPYLYTYLKEVADRGAPIFRPVGMQYPEDDEAWNSPETFMIGDELLFTAGKQIYLPRGLWTNFCTGVLYRGRQRVAAPEEGCPMVHNGTIIPVAVGQGKMELHYYPRLAAEFFLAEPGYDHPTQLHASPAGEYLRLQIESLVARDYEWVVHHVTAPESVDRGEFPQYDARKKQLRVNVKAAAASDMIVNIRLKEPL
jgi:alpha-glucosidase (family GH31 glycosyl hydrolase)